MKRILTTLALIGLSAYAITNPIFIKLGWTNPNPPGEVDVCKIYTTNNITAPMPWQLMMTVSGDVTNVSIAAFPGKAFYYVTLSNFWGETGPSNITNTPIVPTNINTLGITR